VRDLPGEDNRKTDFNHFVADREATDVMHRKKRMPFPASVRDRESLRRAIPDETLLHGRGGECKLLGPVGGAS
jgi:hypothetical protein